ncbi:XRE family transcriptional regulator [Paenibacillus larvae]
MDTIKFSKNLKKLRIKKGISKSELAKKIGVSDVTIGYWESGKTEPRMGKIELIANVLGVATDDLLFQTKVSEKFIPVKGSSCQVPLYGSIAAGTPLEMIKVDQYIEIPEHICETYPEAFLLQVNGDSMNKIVPSGSFALINPCVEVANGEVAAVTVNGYEATLKRFYRLQNTIVLEPDSYNPDYTAKTFNPEENYPTIEILGKMVWFMSPFDIKF